ncbi:MAG: M48 family metallopeptidase [Dysgonamonadaceae bacterium]|nr:M48 family metallopeptidase [Dysgonamonadaceae bacterium]
MSRIVEDKDLGTITLRKRLNARNYTIRLSRGKVSISLPVCGSYRRALDFLEEYRPRLIKRMEESRSKLLPVVEESVWREKAEEYLPLRLENFAKMYDFHYTSVKISKSRTRWGSCSSRQTINLSFYLMLLPGHLADYVLLHELCHTVYMNHGPEFWKLLDSVTKGRAKQLRKELRSYRWG